MRSSLVFATLLFGLLSWSVSRAAAQEQPAAEPPPEAGLPDEPDDGKTVQLALEAGMHTAKVTRILFTPDSKQAITVSLDKSIRFWDLETGKTVRVLRPHSTTGSGQILDAALSADGQLLAIQAFGGQLEGKTVPGRICLIRLGDGQVLHTWPGSHRTQWAALCFSADGQLLAAADGTSGKAGVRLYNTASGKMEKELAADAMPWPQAKLCSVAFSPDGQFLAVGAAGEYGLRVWSLAAGRELHRISFRSKDHVTQAIAWSPDGTLLAFCGNNGSVQVLERDGEMFKELWKKTGIGSGTRFLAFTPDGGQLLHAGHSGPSDGRPVFLRDARTGKSALAEKNKDQPLLTIPTEDNHLETGAISADGRWLTFTGASPQDVFVSKRDGSLQHRLGGKVQSLARAAWAMNGVSVAWNDTKPAKGAQADLTRSFNLATLEFDKPLPDRFHEPMLTRGDLALRHERDAVNLYKGNKKIAHLAVGNPSLTLLANDLAALAGREDPIWLFGTSSGKRIKSLAAHTAGVTSLAPSPDGRYLLSAGKDQVLHIWNTEKAPAVKGKVRPLLSLFFAGDEWVVWTQEGYYAASPGGEKLIGWVSGSGPSKPMTFHPAQRFREKLYQPDVVKRVLKEGSVEAALKAAKVQKQDIEKLLPPQASLRLRKQEGARATVDALALANASTLPVSELHLLVDGRPARTANGGLAVKLFDTPQRGEVKETWTIDLEPGRHRLSVRVLAHGAYSVSEEVSMEEVKAPAPANNRRGTLHYVGVGINQFQHDKALNLSGAVLDVTRMDKCLGAIAPARFVAYKPILLTNGGATHKAIVEKLGELAKQLKPIDVVIVHYSSHGEVEDDGGLYLLTHDSKRDKLKETALPGQKLRDILGQYPCPVLLILDACHSGKFPLMRPPTDQLSRMLADDSCGVAVLTAALAHQKAIDTTDGGVFTKALIDGLKGEAKPDAVTKRLYVHHLFTYTFDTVARETQYKQMPLYLPSGSVPPIVLKE